MIALRIPDQKDFMNKLLIGEAFDSFCLVEATITTFNTFSIDGEIHRDFFDTDAGEMLEKRHLNYSPWKEVKSWCLSVFRGKRLPVSFKIIFRLSPSQTEAFAAKLGENTPSELIRGLFLNLQYRNQELLVTSGISLQTFSPDKSPERLWDSMLLDFFKQHEIMFETY